MKFKLLLASYLSISLLHISCSKVSFSNAPTSECEAQGCSFNPDGTETYRRNLTVQFPNNKVDILFVIDNSGTMLNEQQQIASRFPGFIQSIQNLDWRIAIATTDNYPKGVYSDINNGEYRDGKLVPFRASPTNLLNSTYYIDKTTPSAQVLFQNTIQRPETLACAAQPWNCHLNVSGDERGILTAVKQVLNPSPAAFMRPDAQLHIVFIADEDVRSNGGGFVGMSLEANDKPETLIQFIEATNKRFQLHSIINLPTMFQTFAPSTQSYQQYLAGGFANCVSSQIGDVSRQEYMGCHYALGSAMSGGVIGDIRNTNYTQVLSNISYNIQDSSLAQFDFNCLPRQVVITPVEGQPYPSFLQNPYIVNDPGTRYIRFNPPLPPGTQLNVQWTCPRGSI